MTTLIAWVSYQNGNQTALNLAGDSRITWQGTASRWDTVRKLYWCKSRPDVFGYAGDVVSMSTLLSQVADLIDHSVVQVDQLSAEARHCAYIDLIKSSFDMRERTPDVSQLTMFHGSREGTGTSARFRLWRSKYDAESKRLDDAEITVPIGEESFSIAAGSGGGEFRTRRDAYWKRYGKTARVNFRALLDVAKCADIKGTGGSPQVVSIGRDGPPKPVGVFVDGKCSFMGMPLDGVGRNSEIEWRDDNYTLLKGKTLVKLSNASEHSFW